jgi:hypothetical protein
MPTQFSMSLWFMATQFSILSYILGYIFNLFLTLYKIVFLKKPSETPNLQVVIKGSLRVQHHEIRLFFLRWQVL